MGPVGVRVIVDAQRIGEDGVVLKASPASGGFNWSSQHLDRGGVQQWRRSFCLRRRARFLKGLDAGGARIARCGRRQARLGRLTPVEFETIMTKDVAPAA